MRHCVYLLGQPGSGKSTLMAALLKGQYSVPVAKPLAHRVLPRLHAIELGVRREEFSGTDALAMNVQPLATAWLTSAAFPYSLVLGEGDRLANDRFFTALQQAGWGVQVIYLKTPDALAEQRCAARGSHQNATWIAGRRTKVLNVARRWATEQWTLDGALPTEALVAVVRGHHVLANCFSPSLASDAV